jgi:microcompartment protein CcmL/EutN
MSKNSVGLIELSSITSGFGAADAMLKAADVEIILARTICSGKYIVMVRGDTGAIHAAVEAGVQAGGFGVIDSFIIPNLHEAIFPAISGTTKVEAIEALGVVESFSVASLIEGADAAVKAANVQLIEMRLAMALGGKAFVTMTGNVAAVQAAVEAGAQAVAQKGMLVNRAVIASPRPELLTDLI